MKGMMKVKLVIALLVVIAVAIFYYVSLPAINIHATETWKFIFLILAVLFVLYIVRKAKIAGQSKIELSFIKEYTGLKIGVIVFLLFLAVYVAGSILSSPIVNAAKYQKLLKLSEQIRKKIQKGKPLDQIADELEEVPETIRPLYEKIKQEMLQ
jgi:hypothetical protein